MTKSPSEQALREMISFSKAMRKLVDGPAKGRAAAMLKATNDHAARMTKIRETTNTPPPIDLERLAHTIHYVMDSTGIAKGGYEHYLDRVKNEPHYARRVMHNPIIRDTYHATK